ncbi:hypothetical protein V8E53_012148 [Lactarius tabidus]
MDPNVVREQLALQMQIYVLNNGGMVSDSTLSPSSTPFSGPQYNSWTFLQMSNAFGSGRRGGIAESTAKNHGLHLRRRAKVRPPPHVESTQPRDKSPELSSGEESAGEFKAGEHSSDPQRYAPRPAHRDESADDEDDEDVGGMEGVADDLLQLEFHTDYLHALDRETDATLVFLAAPSQTGKLHSVASRAVRRDSSLHESTDMVCI